MSKPKYRWVAMFYDGDETTICYHTKQDAEHCAAERAKLYGCEYFLAQIGSWSPRYQEKEFREPQPYRKPRT